MSSTTSPYAMVYTTGPITIDRKIIDCFIFYNELQMLTYRLNILYDIVDYFIIVESTHTFTGESKNLYFNENKHLFEKFQGKIIHIIVEDFPYIYPNIDMNKEEQWRNEDFQRDAITRGFKKKILNENDIIVLCDVDEIPDPDTLGKIKRNEIEVKVHALKMDFYYYNLNSKKSDPWIHPKIMTYSSYKNTNRTLAQIRLSSCPVIPEGGWHLSYFGDSQFIKNKIENFSHQELNYHRFTDTTKIDYRIKEGIDLFDRTNYGECIIKIPIKENPYLPPQYETYLQNFVVI